MQVISIENIVPGMKTAEDVKDARGRVLIPAGADLEDKHIRALKMWGVLSVTVEGGDDKPAGAAEPETQLTPEDLERIRSYVNEMFSLNYHNRENPMFKTLFILCVKRLAKKRIIPDIFQFPRRKEPADGEAEQPPALPPQNINDMIVQTKTLASLPTVYDELMKVVNHPHSSAQDVANVISSDQSLTARLLRIVNSTFYSFPAAIETVSRAITIVGTAQLCDLALATSVMKMFGKELEGVVDMDMFWRHSIACGVFARIFANMRREANSEGFFVMGLLHDLGRLIMYAHAPNHSRRALDEAHARKMPMNSVEKEIFGFNHAELGTALLESWNLPPVQREAVGRHHRPNGATRFPVEAATIHVSDMMAKALHLGRSGDLYVPPLFPEAWDKMKVSHTLLPDIVRDAETQIGDLMRIFSNQ